MLRTEHRIVAFWDEKDTKDKYFISTLCRDFNVAFQEMVADMGPPTRVVFRTTDEGWRQERLLKFFAGFESLEDAEWFLRDLTDEEREFIKAAKEKRTTR